jgi:hypothetical protein
MLLQKDNYFDLENMVDQRRLEENPQGELGRLYGLVIIDEVQRLPAIFPVLRYLCDRPDNPAKFLLLGSAAPSLIAGVTESLAGRVAYVDIGGFNVAEIPPQHHETLWLQGGLPRAFLQDETSSFNWRLDYLRTLIEQDLRDLATLRIPPAALRRLLYILAQSHGQVWNNSEAAKLLTIDYKTVQRYLELFEGTFLIRLLRPFSTNLKKRLRKAPKLYFRDVGLAHALLSIRSYHQLRGLPFYGASWEGFALEQVIRVLGLREEECFTHAVHSGEEMDLVVERGGRIYGFEFKGSADVTATPSMLQVQQDLKLAKVYIVYPGPQNFSLRENIEVIGLANLPQLRGRWEAV